MYIEKLCAPALIFVMIMMLHLVFEIYDKNYPMAFAKFVSSIIVILFLQLLCVSGLEIISWIIVFLPLMIYTYTTFVLYSVFGDNPNKAIKQFEVNKI